MDSSVAARFLAASSLIPNYLVDARGMAGICDVARHLPGALGANYVIECRLGDAARVADFSLRIVETDAGHAVLAGLAPNAPIAPQLLQHPIWRQVTGFARAWADGDPELRDMAVWLEFDTAAANAAASLPSIFFQPGIDRRTTVTDDCGQPLVRSGAWDPAQLERVLARWPLTPATKQNLARCFAALPPSSGIESLGLLLPRVPADLRLTISPLDSAKTLAFLEAIDWPGRGPDFEGFVELWPGFSRQLRLNLDVGDVIGPRISVECYWNCPPSQFRADARWRGLFERLIARRHALPDKCRAFYDPLPYVEDTGDTAQAWPTDLRDMSQLLHRSHRSLFWWFPLHLKLGYQPGRPVECKAYFSFIHRWWPYPSA